MASMWRTLRSGGHAQLFLHHVGGAMALVLGVLIVSGCSLDTRTLNGADAGAPAESGGTRASGGTSSGGPADRVPSPTDIPVCSYSSGSVAPGCETLAKNAGFAKNAEGWSNEPYSIDVAWSPEDAAESSSSGSVSVTNSLSAPEDGIAPGGGMQCLEVQPGATYVMAGDVFIPAGQGDGMKSDGTPGGGPYVGQAGLSVLFWRGENCAASTPTIRNFQTQLVDQTGTWTHVEGSAVAPEGVASMSIRLLTVKVFKQYNFKAVFDNVLVQKWEG